jgi:hypothetical protein
LSAQVNNNSGSDEAAAAHAIIQQATLEILGEKK